MSRVVAIIPARGGSKGIIGKNLRRVGGVPLVVRAIEAARASGVIDRIVVSTDDSAIAAEAREHGADVVVRPAEISGDQAGSESAVLHALEAVDPGEDRVEAVAFLQATSPFIDVDALRSAIELVREGTHDSVFSAAPSHRFLWRRAEEFDSAEAVNHEVGHRPRRQDREPEFVETGAFYAFTADGFRRARHRFFGRIGIAEVAEGSEIEIDSPRDLEAARLLAPLWDRAAARIDVDALVTDFDGVHTDDTASVDTEGRESVRVSRSDGMGIALLRRAGIPVLILSTEANSVVVARARKLGVEVLSGVGDKRAVLRDWAEERGVALTRIAYLGNDVNDLGCLEIVGWPIAVHGSHPLVQAAARWVTSRKGGDGAVREVADRVLEARPERPDHETDHDIPPRERTSP